MHAGVGATNSCHAKIEAGSIEPAFFISCSNPEVPGAYIGKRAIS